MGARKRRHREAAASRGSDASPLRQRPRNRRAQIAAVSAEAFGSLGYHAVSMGDIASQLDISSAALYRHYPSKYALFREEILRLGELGAAAAQPAPEPDQTSEDRYRRIIDALIDAAVDNRRSAALLRWQRRYLHSDDATLLRDQLRIVDNAARTAIAEIRPPTETTDLAILSTTTQSVLTSIGDHRVAIGVRSLRGLLEAACHAVATTSLPAQDTTGTTTHTIDTAGTADSSTTAGASDARSTAAEPGETPMRFTHELLLVRAVELFHERGYPNVSVDDIATAAGLPAVSAVYRFYRGKGDILAAAFRRAADRVSAAIGPAVAESADREQALHTLIDLFVAGSFDERELTFVYYAEVGNIAPAERTVLRNIQRLNVEEWAKLLRAVRPELTAAETRVLVHAALALVVDLGQRFGSDDPGCSRTRVAHLMRTVLFGHSTTTVASPEPAAPPSD